MKRHVLSLSVAVLTGIGASAQAPRDLIAHWPMSGTGADISGKNHNGTMYGLFPAAGRSGLPNTSLYFDGATSAMSVPYQPDLNLTHYSICATVKVVKFNTGRCQANYILARDAQFAPASYSLNFFDNPYNDCYTLDTTREVFAAEAGVSSGTHAAWRYSPNIVNNRWYSVVATWDGSALRIYVDGVQMSTNPVANPVPLGSSAAGILIGRLSTTGGYQYPFTGFMDDLRIYGRVLCPQEIIDYSNSTLDAQARTPVEYECEQLNIPGSGQTDPDPLHRLRLYPNPAQKSVTIGGDAAGADYWLINTLGQAVEKGKFQSGNPILSIAKHVPGVYILRIRRGNAETALRFVRR